MQKAWKLRLLLAVGAVCSALTLIFPAVGFLEWVSMIPLVTGCFLLCRDDSTGLFKAYRYGFFTVFCYYFVLYHWFLYLYPLDFAGLDNLQSAVVVIAAWVGLTLLQAIPGGLIFLFFRLMEKGGIFQKNAWLRPVAFASLWTVFEWSSTFFWTGVPWGRLALGQVEYLPMLQSASLFGSYFVGFLILAVNGLFACAILYPSKRVFSAVCAFVLLFSNFLFGVLRMQISPETERRVKVAVIQPNVNSHDKWDAGNLSNLKSVHAELTRAAAREGAEIAVFAETAFPYTLNWNQSLESYCSDLAKECGVTLVVGAFCEEDDKEYNSLFFVSPDGKFSETRYDKRHLVPFGEYVPMRDLIMALIPPLAEVGMLEEDLAPGDSASIYETPFGKVGSSICFDSIYEALVLDSVHSGAELMILSTNDSWFYDSAGVYLHESQAKLRAVECGRYWVRSANTGISAVIDIYGNALCEIPPLEKGYAVADVFLRTGNTLYGTLGNTFVYLCIAVVIFSMLPWEKIRRKQV